VVSSCGRLVCVCLSRLFDELREELLEVLAVEFGCRQPVHKRHSMDMCAR
jgi:hypothetical protein